MSKRQMVGYVGQTFKPNLAIKTKDNLSHPLSYANFYPSTLEDFFFFPFTLEKKKKL